MSVFLNAEVNARKILFLRGWGRNIHPPPPPSAITVGHHAACLVMPDVDYQNMFHLFHLYTLMIDIYCLFDYTVIHANLTRFSSRILLLIR